MVNQSRLARLIAVKARHEAALMRKANVVGVGIGFRPAGAQELQPAIIVSVTHKVPLSHLRSEDVVPSELEGFPVHVQAIGQVSVGGP